MDDALQGALGCVHGYVEAGHCDWEHWSEMYAVCEPHRFAVLDNGRFLDVVKAGDCSVDNWPAVYEELLGEAWPGSGTTAEARQDTVALPEEEGGFSMIIISDTQVGRFWEEEVKQGGTSDDGGCGRAKAVGPQRYLQDGAAVFNQVGCTYEVDAADEACCGAAEASRWKSYALERSMSHQAKMVDSLNNSFLRPGYPVHGLIVNGDLTEYGHPEELAIYQHYYDPPRAVLETHRKYEAASNIDVPVFPGLGNHDYEIPSDPNSRRMLRYLLDHLKGTPGCAHSNRFQTGCWDAHGQLDPYKLGLVGQGFVNEQDFDLRLGLISFDTERRLRGSLSYSWDVGNVHFVQLNYYPSFEPDIGLTDITSALTPDPRFNKVPGTDKYFSWLERDLHNARAAHKSIIINMHDFWAVRDNTEFSRLMDAYDVSAIFAGHFHSVAMRFDAVGEDQVPVFLSGSVMPGYKATGPSTAGRAGDTHLAKGCTHECLVDDGNDAICACEAMHQGTYIQAKFGRTQMQVVYYEVPDGGSRIEIGRDEVLLATGDESLLSDDGETASTELLLRQTGASAMLMSDAGTDGLATQVEVPVLLAAHTLPLKACAANCGEWVPFGECTQDSQCSEAEHCDFLGRCIPDRGNNGSCTNHGECLSNICSAGFCAECVMDSQCAADKHCNVVGDCIPDRGNNGSCTNHGECLSNICSAGLCAECVQDNQCPANKHCNVVGDCIPDRGNNGSCTNHGECLSNICSAGFCAECVMDSQCPADKHCNVVGDCIPDRGNNGSCSNNAECLSNICISGLCAQCRWGKTYDQCPRGQTCNILGDCH